MGEAYWTFVDYYQNLFQIPVVAITGTSGKTTTKEMITNIGAHYLGLCRTLETYIQTKGAMYLYPISQLAVDLRKEL